MNQEQQAQKFEIMEDRSPVITQNPGKMRCYAICTTRCSLKSVEGEHGDGLPQKEGTYTASIQCSAFLL